MYRVSLLFLFVCLFLCSCRSTKTHHVSSIEEYESVIIDFFSNSETDVLRSKYFSLHVDQENSINFDIILDAEPFDALYERKVGYAILIIEMKQDILYSKIIQTCQDSSRGVSFKELEVKLRQGELESGGVKNGSLIYLAPFGDDWESLLSTTICMLYQSSGKISVEVKRI